MKKKPVMGVLLLTAIFLTFSGAVCSTMAEEPVTLRAVSFLAKNNVQTDSLFIFQKTLEEKADGKIKIEYLGGPEAVPSFEQIEAVKSGLVDMSLLPTAYYVPQIPVVDAVKLSRITPWEERKTGAYDFINKMHQEKVNAYYLGRFTNNVQFHLYLKKKIDKPDFTGMKIRVTPIYKPFVEALGGVAVTTAAGEVYTALERGVVDGYGWPSVKISDFGWHEVTDYVIDPGFYQVDVGIIVNLDVWNRLSQENKELLISAAKEAEHKTSEHFAKLKQEERELIFSKGVEVIEFTGEDRKTYLDAAYKAGWEQVLSKSPELGAKYKKMVE